MQTIKSLKSKLSLFDAIYHAAAVLKKHETELADRNRDQLMHGKTNKDENIDPIYQSKWYAENKQFINSLPENWVPDLKSTGAFHESIYVRVKGYGLVFGATDSKTRELEVKYSKDIFGINKENRIIIIDSWLLADMVNVLKNFIKK